MRTPNVKMRRQIVYIPIDLVERAEATARDLHIGFSQLVREALDHELAQRERSERELAEACRRYRQFNREYAPDWARFEATFY